MSQKVPELEARHCEFIKKQKLFFVATAASDGRVNMSPKGMDSLRVIDQQTVAWLNLTGSGNETAAHVIENKRMTLMFCAFEGSPIILRLYGSAQVFHERSEEWSQYESMFPDLPGTRQIFLLKIDLVQTSCGMGVPLFDYREDRKPLMEWAEKQSSESMAAYWKKANLKSIDGKPTDIFGS